MEFSCWFSLEQKTVGIQFNDVFILFWPFTVNRLVNKLVMLNPILKSIFHGWLYIITELKEFIVSCIFNIIYSIQMFYLLLHRGLIWLTISDRTKWYLDGKMTSYIRNICRSQRPMQLCSWIELMLFNKHWCSFWIQNIELYSNSQRLKVRDEIYSSNW